ncbi:cysteine proteinase [Meredithblackwellia eburnea MCA 4105]
MSSEPELKKLKVTELKELLKEQGKAVSGKKDDLIARLLEEDGTTAQEKEQEAGQPDEQNGDQVMAEQEQEPQEEVLLDAAPLDEPAQPAPKEGKSAAEETSPTASLPPAPVPATRTTTNGEQSTSAVRSHPSDAEEVAVTEERETKRARVEPLQPEVHTESVPAIPEEEEEPPVYDFEPEELDSSRPTDMYLDTINRPALDFDFERLCSVTLSHNHIYACLCDGKFFTGRGKSSPAYRHAVGEDHHVFINLTTQKVYVLPDSYEVLDPSLDDIKYLLFPIFTPALLSKIDLTPSPSYDLSLRPYYPGFVGLQNIKNNSWMNAILHSLAHVLPLRDYFLLPAPANSPPRPPATELVTRFDTFLRKLWNPKQFKPQVSPHELLQEVANRSAGKFRLTEVGDPLEFLGWLLNTLHRDLGGSKKSRSSIIYSTFQGEVRVDDQQVISTGESGGKPRFDLGREIKSTLTPFLFLTLDLPSTPVFQEALESRNIIPQVPLQELLAKYDGLTTQETGGVLRRFKVTRLPPFLVLHIKRFTKNNFVEEKNPTIVNFPLKGVEMQDYLDPKPTLTTYYDLVSNITHSSAAGTVREETTWKTQMHLGSNTGDEVDGEERKWFQIQDLIVEDIGRELIGLGESYVQIWELRTKDGKHNITVDPPKAKAKK